MSRLRLLVAPLAFGVAVASLLAAGRGDLRAPPVAGFGDWLEARGPVTAAFALVRLVALAAAVWMLVVATVAAVARLAGAARLATLAEQAMAPGVRRVLTGLAGVGAASAVVLGTDRGPSGDAAATLSARELPILLAQAPPASPPASPPPGDGSSDTITMSLLPPEEWTVAPGNSFWAIAEEVLADEFGRSPSDAEIVPYWRRLIDANRDRLVSDDPDLILPGQVFTLPSRAVPS